MRILFLLSMVLACKSVVRTAPDSQLQAISDGRLTLGAVASVSEEGEQVYRLLLCRNGAVTSEDFSNPSLCLSALVDANGQEVVLLTNKIRRRFGAKYIKYALGAGAAVLVAAGAYSGIKWYKMTPKYISEAAQASDGVAALLARKQQFGEHVVDAKKIVDDMEKSIAKTTEELSNHNTKLAEQKDTIDELTKEISEALEQNNDQRVGKAISRVEKIDPQLGAELATRVKGGSGTLDDEMLDTFIRYLDDSDRAFAQTLETIRTNPHFDFGAEGKKYFQERSRSLNKKAFLWVNVIEQNGFDKFLQNETATKAFVNYFNEINQATLSYAEASSLHMLERQKKALLAIRDGETIDVAKVQKEIDELQAKYYRVTSKISSPAADTAFTSKFDTVTKSYNKFGREHFLGLEDNNMLDYVRVLDDYSAGLSNFHEIQLKEQQLEYFKGLKDGTVDFHQELKSLNDGSISRRHSLIWSEVDRVTDTMIANTISNVAEGIDRTAYGWLQSLPDEMLGLLDKTRSLRAAEDQVRQKRALEVGEEVKKLETVLAKQAEQLSKKQKLLDEVKTKKFATAEDIRQAEWQLQAEREYLDVNRGNLDVMRSSLGNADAEVSSKLAKLEEDLQLTRRLYGTVAVAGASIPALGAVALALNKSIWARGEQTVGKSAWNQIFADDQDFANALKVDDLSTIIERLAELFGQQVNRKALQL